MRAAVSARRVAGFSLAELLIALALVTGVVLAVLLPVTAGVRLTAMQPDVADLDQRLRVLASSIRGALENAGRGASAGVEPGTLALRAPAVFPHRRGAASADPPESAWSDRFTVVAAIDRARAPALSLPMTLTTSLVAFGMGPPCHAADLRCGFRAGEFARVDDRLGFADLFRITAAEAGVLAHAPAALSRAYAPADEARVLHVDVRHFRFDAARRQVRAGSGEGTETPLVDEVLAFDVQMFGSARPPPQPRPPLGVSTCLVDEHGVTRLPVLPGAVGGLVPLTVETMSDGPFCGDGAGRYDADLLRVRRVRVRARLGRSGGAGAGLVPTAFDRVVDNREVVVDVTIRNLHVPE